MPPAEHLSQHLELNLIPSLEDCAPEPETQPQREGEVVEEAQHATSDDHEPLLENPEDLPLEDVLDGEEPEADDFTDYASYQRVLDLFEGTKFHAGKKVLEPSWRVVSEVWNKFLRYTREVNDDQAKLYYFAMRPKDQKKDLVFNSAIRYIFQGSNRLHKEDFYRFESFLFVLWIGFLAAMNKYITIGYGSFLILLGVTPFYFPVLLAIVKLGWLMLSRVLCDKSKKAIQQSVPYPNINMLWVVAIASLGSIPLAMEMIPGSYVMTAVTFGVMAILLTHLPVIAAKSAINNLIVVVLGILALALASVVGTLKPRYLWTKYHYPFAESAQLHALVEKYHEAAAVGHMTRLWNELDPSSAVTPPTLVEEEEEYDWLYTYKTFPFSFITETVTYGVLLAACGLYPTLMKCIPQRVAMINTKSKESVVQTSKEPEVGLTSWLGLVTRSIILMFLETASKWYLWKGTFVAMLIGSITTLVAIFFAWLVLKIIVGPLVEMAASAAVAGKSLADGNSTFGVYFVGSLINAKMQNEMYVVITLNLIFNLLVVMVTRSMPVWAFSVIAIAAHIFAFVSKLPVKTKQSIALMSMALGNLNYVTSVYMAFQIFVKKNKDFELFVNPLPTEAGGNPVVYQT